MQEYVMAEDEDKEKVAQDLLANTDNPDHVVWQPRSGVPHGGVFLVDDDLAGRLMTHRRAVAEAADAAELEAAEVDKPVDGGDDREQATPEEFEFDANTLSDEEWAAKYPDDPRPELDGADLPPAANEEPAVAEPGTAASRKRARRAAASETDPEVK